MSEIPKAYEPQAVEAKWYQFWLDRNCFTADPHSTKPAYSIVIPPPNVTGVLTLGHVLNNTIQDILARKARMDGKEVLWLPGTDHAGIATENVVSRQLRKEEHKTKQEVGREEFLKRVWTWQEKHGGIILNQLKALGASCDWARTRFTMDEHYKGCVTRVFVDLYKKGLIYRGKRMVNWCPVSLTALSDEEVIMKEQKGALYYFKVEVAEMDGVVGQTPSSVTVQQAPSPAEETAGGGARRTNTGEGAGATTASSNIRSTGIFLTIATTRPETIPGDTAVAVNPKDMRYAHLIGKHVVRPLPAELPGEQKLIPIIGDEHVDFEFGTGVLKVTPAHDKADFEIGQRHKLAVVDIMNSDATMNDLAGADLRGLDRFKARKVAVEKLTELGALEKEEPYTNNVGFSERADVPIEPRLSEQWFLKYPSVKKAKDCVEQTHILEKTVSTVTLSGRELAGNDRAALRESALKLARERKWLGHKFTNKDTGWEILVRRRSLSHAFSARNAAAIQAVAGLPQLIETAIWLRSEAHVPPAPDFKAVHHFVAALRLGGELFRIPITAKELPTGQLLYDHKAKKITPGGKPLGPHPKGKLGLEPAPGACITVRELMADVNAPDGAMKFYPERWAKVYDHWMTGIQDWCISRQLWWGHRIPVWHDELRCSALKKEILVLELTGYELPGKTARDLRRAAFAHARQRGFLNSDFHNRDTGLMITVRKSSLEHAFSNPGLENIFVVPVLPDLLKHAVRTGIEAHQPTSPEIKCVHVFHGAVRIRGRLFRVKFTVKEFFSGLKLYDHQAIETEIKKEFDGESPEAHLLSEKLAHRPTSNSVVKMRDLFGDVNRAEAFTRCQEVSPGEGWTQDPDVLDTWFSSWLWPFATMGWPEKTDTLKKFYPTTDLVTGPDIIFFWVARMIMAGYEWMGEMPFRNVYFTGIIRDKQGRKMSKSLGNSPDPLDLINTYGADALRFGIMRSAPQGQDLLFDEQSVELGRNFCNKLWNACRFRQMQSSAECGVRNAESEDASAVGNSALRTPHSEFEGEIRTELLTSDDKWILLRLDTAIREVTDALNNYKFNEAANTLYRFFWSEYCDWYVESTKAILSPESSSRGNEALTQGRTDQSLLTSAVTRKAARRENTLAVMDFVLSNTLRLFHPFLPFITEELWQGMGFNHDLPKDQGGNTIMFARWPKPFDQDMKDFYALDDCYLERVEAKHELVRQGRNLRREANVSASKKVSFILKPANDLPPHDLEVLKILLNAERFDVDAAFEPSKGTARAITPLGELFLPLEGLIDFAAERARLQKELAKIGSEIEKVAAKLANPNFTQKVPPQVLAEHQQRLADWNAKLAQVQAALDALGEG